MAQKTVHVKATRGFVFSGAIVEPGQVKEVPLMLGRELVAAGQAERFDPNDPANKPASEQLQTRTDAPQGAAGAAQPDSTAADPKPAASGRGARGNKE